MKTEKHEFKDPFTPPLSSGVRQSMKTPRAEVFAVAADKLEAWSKVPSDKDDPKWLRSNARGFR